ncbi:tectonic-1 [Centropristis striata]|uniref:tectonic-1 n=1 Tax=Centropristis striata TaxID=184440 RepID=UPI0027E14590|nr:tectonic-1 [Centropristis striata]
MAVLWSTFHLLSLFFFFISVTTSENTISDDFNTTFSDQNVTFNFTDSFTTPQPAEFHSTTQTPRTSTEEPAESSLLPGEPLPVSGRLLTPLSKVGSLCPCDEIQDVCDVNCCCDRACSDEVALFTSCSVDTVSGRNRLCIRDVASYSLVITIDGFSELRSSVRKETNYDVFCIQSQSRVDGLSHPSPALPTDTNFDSLFKKFTSFIFGPEESRGQGSTAELQAASGYQYGDVVVTAGHGGDRGTFWLPAAGLTADCVDNSPAAFLKDQSSRCSRRVLLDQDCSALPALSSETYTNIQVFAGKNKDAEVVPVEVDSVVLQAVDGTQTELKISGGEKFKPVLLEPGLCSNVVLKVSYVVKYSPAGEMVNVSVSLVLGFVREAVLSLEQEFHITFFQEDEEEVAVHYSGNPGYVAGLPLVSGTRTEEGIARSVDPGDTLSVLHSAEDQDCLQGPHRRSPLLFGLDSVSGCTLRLQDAANCSLVSQVLLDVLRGPNYVQYVASFGNSPLDNPLDWVPITRNFNPEDAQSCSIPLSLHLEVEWTKYGSLVNPQAQIVRIKEVIQTNTTSLDMLSGGSSVLPISTSVAFIPVSAAALPGYRATPTINARLPFDFFFPFV